MECLNLNENANGNGCGMIVRGNLSVHTIESVVRVVVRTMICIFGAILNFVHRWFERFFIERMGQKCNFINFNMIFLWSLNFLLFFFL